MDLASLDALYTQTETKPKGDFAHMPDGKYQVSVHMVESKETSTKKPMLVWQLKVLAGPHTGRLLFKNSVIDVGTIAFLKQDLTTIGYSGLPSALVNDPLERNKLLDRKLEVSQKTKPSNDSERPNVNVYFNKSLSAVAGSAADNDATPF